MNKQNKICFENSSVEYSSQGSGWFAAYFFPPHACSMLLYVFQQVIAAWFTSITSCTNLHMLCTNPFYMCVLSVFRLRAFVCVLSFACVRCFVCGDKFANLRFRFQNYSYSCMKICVFVLGHQRKLCKLSSGEYCILYSFSYNVHCLNSPYGGLYNIFIFFCILICIWLFLEHFQ